MDLARALEFAATRRTAVLTTLRRDGRPQQSVVYYALDSDRFWISVTERRAKTRNLRRDPRSALWIGGSGEFEWVAIDGMVALTEPAREPEDAVADALVEYYRRGTGEHPDWQEYRAAMVAEERLLLTFVPMSATGMLPDDERR